MAGGKFDKLAGKTRPGTYINFKSERTDTVGTSERGTAIIPLMKEHYIMLRRNLLYTAISRAKEKVILIGQRQAVYMAIHRSDVDKRNTVFADRIGAYLNREKQKRAS